MRDPRGHVEERRRQPSTSRRATMIRTVRLVARRACCYVSAAGIVDLFALISIASPGGRLRDRVSFSAPLIVSRQSQQQCGADDRSTRMIACCRNGDRAAPDYLLAAIIATSPDGSAALWLGAPSSAIKRTRQFLETMEVTQSPLYSSLRLSLEAVSKLLVRLAAH